MDPAPESLERSRQACEPCRRKKTRCPAERPICSFCQRLNVRCVYLPREHTRPPGSARKVAKPKDTKDRVRVLESQVNELYHTLHSEVSHDVHDHAHSSSAVSNMFLDVSGPQTHVKFSLSQPEPSMQALNCLIEVYRTSIHLQPLPLLGLGGLTEYLTRAPRSLRYSFLALTLNFSCPDFYTGKREEAIELYTRSAQETANEMASEPVSSVELTQTLCFLALGYIKAHKIAKAWMATGTAARLEIFRNMTQDSVNDYHCEASSRSYWSAFLLERIFFSQQTSLRHTGNTVDYPPSCPWPSPIYPERETGYRSGISSLENIKDPGINVYFIGITSIWGDIVSYLHEVRSGKVEVSWSPDSAHTRLITRLHELDSHMSQRHLLRNVFLTKRSRDEIDRYREYWIPWAMMQIMLHSSWAMVNHPFIHLVAVKEKTGFCQVSNFLQQIVDQALFHAGWVFRLVRTFDDMKFELNNPVIGLLVAATASIPWMFQFAKDTQVSSNADRDLGTCVRTMEQIATSWTSISHKLKALRTLQAVVESDLQNEKDEGTTIRFQPSVFWELFSPRLQLTAQHKQAAHEVETSPLESGQDTRIRVATHFVHPLVDDQSEQPDLPNIAGTSAFPSVEEFEYFPMGELFAQFSTEDLNLLPP